MNKEKGKPSRSFKYIGETLLGFVALNAVNYILFPKDMGFLHFPLHPYWLVILPLTCRYGFGAGLFSGLVAFFHYIAFYFGGIPSRLALEMIAESGDLFIPILFVAMGVFLGDIIKRHIQKGDQLSELAQKTEGDVHQMELLLKRERDIRNELESRIVGETMTVKALYEAASRFESLDLAEIYQGCLDILQSYFQVERASFYMREGDFLLLKSSIGDREENPLEGKISCDSSSMQVVLKNKKLVTVKDILEEKNSEQLVSEYGKVLAMIPLKDQAGEVVGVVNIEAMDYLALNQPNLDLMELLVDWTGRAIHNVFYLENIKGRIFWSEDYQCYEYPYLESVLEREWLRAKKFSYAFSLAVIKIEKFGFYDEKQKKLLQTTLVATLQKSFENMDYVFFYRIQGAFVLVSPMSDEDSVNKRIKTAQKAWEQVLSSDSTLKQNKPQIKVEAVTQDKEKSVDGLLKKALSSVGLDHSKEKVS